MKSKKYLLGIALFGVFVLSFISIRFVSADQNEAVYKNQIRYYPMHQIEMRRHKEVLKKKIRKLLQEKKEYNKLQAEIKKIEDELVELREKAEQYQSSMMPAPGAQRKKFNRDRKKVLTALDKVEVKHLELIERSDHVRQSIEETEKYLKADSSRW